MPEQVYELFLLAGKNPADHFEYDRLEVVCHYFWEDGKKVKAWADPERFATEVASELGVSEQGIKEVLKRSAFIYAHLSPLFMHRSLHKLGTWLGPQALKAYLNLGKLGLFSTMHAFNKRFLKDPKLVQLFNRYATYNGSDPYQTPATLTIIPHLEFNLGAYFPKQGMHDISMSLYKLALSLGVRYHFNAPVEEILIENVRLVKMICGDSSDNIAGIRGMGLKRLLSLVPELRNQPITVDQVRDRCNQLFEQDKHNKLIANLLTGVTKHGVLGEEFFDVNNRIVSLDEPFLTDDAKETIDLLINEPLDQEGRSYKNAMKMMQEDGIFNILPKAEDAWINFINPFLRLTRKEKNINNNKTKTIKVRPYE